MRHALALCILVAGCGPRDLPAPPPGEGEAGVTLTDEQRLALAALSPARLPAPPPDPTDALADDPRAAQFGQRMFFEADLSGELLDPDNDIGAGVLGRRGETGKVSCAGCHVPGSGFQDTRSPAKQLSLGSGWGIRRAPSLLDVGQSRRIMWDGRFDSLFRQVMGPIESAVEMNSSRLYAAQRIFALHRAEYEALFGTMPPLDDPQRFPPLSAHQTGCRALDAKNACTGPLRGAPGDGAEFDGLAPADQVAVTRVIVNVGKAIAAYERLLSCGPSRFDRWMHGEDTAMSASEQRGAVLFVGKAGCVSCHGGPFMSDEQFHNVGLSPAVASTVFVDRDDNGAFDGTATLLKDPLNAQGAFSDGYDGRDPPAPSQDLMGAFRTPKLRCVSQRPSFMHTAQLRSPLQVVQFFSRGGDAFGFPGTSELEPLHLTAAEQGDLVAFLGALDGDGPAMALRQSSP